MPVRYPAQCRRTLRRAGDTMLGQAVIERPVRALSSHAGPFECRRRLGRRNMTGIMAAASSPHPPIWHFDVVPAPAARWRWQAPSTPAERRSRPRDVSVSSLFNGLISWLEKSDAAKPFLQPPADEPTVSYAAAAAAEAASAPSTAAPAPVEATVDTFVRDISATTVLPEEIAVFRAAVRDLQSADEDSVNRLCKTCRSSLRRRVARGDLSVDALQLAMEPLDWPTQSSIPDQRVANRASAMIRRTILHAIGDTHISNPDAVPRELWTALANHILSSDGSNHGTQLFWRLMSIMPSELRHQIPRDQLHRLTRTFVSAQAQRHNLFAHWSAQTARFAQALSRLSPSQLRALDEDMSSHLTDIVDTPETTRRLRFSWLMVKAYDGSTSHESFHDTFGALIHPDTRINGLQTWQLATARLASSNTLSSADHAALVLAEYSSMPSRWSSLIRLLLDSPNAQLALRHLHASLSSMGQLQTLARALSALPSLARRVIHILDDHHFALLASRSLSHLPWTTWAPFTERIVKDPSVPPTRIWQLLSFSARTSTSSSTKPPGKDAKVALLDQMARWYMEAPHLTDRQVLRRVGECVSRQRALTRAVSPDTLASVVDVVVRDLERGRRGRTTRMEWLVRLVAEAQGEKRAERTLAALKGWRTLVERGEGRK